MVGRKRYSIAQALRYVTYLMAPLLVAACGAGPAESRLQDYQARLARTLQLELPIQSESELARFPRPRDLVAKPVTATIDLIELWSLRDCALHGLIANKNSSLGRVSLSSTKLFHELDFLRLLPACLKQLEISGRDELSTALEQVGNAKRERLPSFIWQALLGGQEYRDYWNLPQQVPDYDAAAGAPAQQAAQALIILAQAWLKNDYRVDRAAVETHLKKMRFGNAGVLQKSLILQHNYLSSLDVATKVRLAERPICFSAGGAPAPVIDNVVRKYFVGELQPWSVQLQKGIAQLQAAQQLEALLALGEPEAFQSWRLKRDELLEIASGAPRRHVQSLLPVLEQCGLSPGQAPAAYPQKMSNRSDLGLPTTTPGT
ncbi:DUF3080 family protein [Candidatus Litorirhabdus singularis]|nr:DUF3080 family protein [Candidatus Litorirhabdus singularis]